MKHLIAAAILAGSLTAAAGAAQAAPGFSPPASVDSGIVLVEGGCGPHGFRDHYGRCHVRRPPPPPPHYRRCPPGLHPTPYGCRPN